MECMHTSSFSSSVAYYIHIYNHNQSILYLARGAWAAGFVFRPRNCNSYLIRRFEHMLNKIRMFKLSKKRVKNLPNSSPAPVWSPYTRRSAGMLCRGHASAILGVRASQGIVAVNGRAPSRRRPYQDQVRRVVATRRPSRAVLPPLPSILEDGRNL